MIKRADNIIISHIDVTLYLPIAKQIGETEEYFPYIHSSYKLHS